MQSRIIKKTDPATKIYRSLYSFRDTEVSIYRRRRFCYTVKSAPLFWTEAPTRIIQCKSGREFSILNFKFVISTTVSELCIFSKLIDFFDSLSPTVDLVTYEQPWIKPPRLANKWFKNFNELFNNRVCQFNENNGFYYLTNSPKYIITQDHCLRNFILWPLRFLNQNSCIPHIFLADSRLSLPSLKHTFFLLCTQANLRCEKCRYKSPSKLLSLFGTFVADRMIDAFRQIETSISAARPCSAYDKRRGVVALSYSVICRERTFFIFRGKIAQGSC